ncbi:hypothetical protein GE09DRAFT_363255 [Coniochaeta sp. 2T2.1]|nr:hypothetical protein GE09DRAFT_363255 [Coniochaeta sp. 2T2.1]
MVLQLQVAAVGLSFLYLSSGLSGAWLDPSSDAGQQSASSRSGQHNLPQFQHPPTRTTESTGPTGLVNGSLRAAGLPSSYEVGILANVVRQLRSQLEHAYNIDITEAVFTLSHLLALYQDYLQDVATHLKLRYVTPQRIHLPIVWETAWAYAGHWRGLCKTWWNDTECMYEELREMPDVHLLGVHCSRDPLTVAMSIFAGAGNLFEPDYRHGENFTLGRDALSDYGREEDYWRDVRRHLLGLMEEFPFTYFPPPPSWLW